MSRAVITIWLFMVVAAASRCSEITGTNDWLLAPLRVHLLAATNAPAVHTTLSQQDVTRILTKINRVWAQARISFWLESLVREEASNPAYGDRMGVAGDLPGLLSLRPEGSKASNMFHLYYVKKFSANGVYLGEAMFVKDTASLREVPGGIDEPLPRVSSHEIGHALSLQHCDEETHLMYRGTTGTNLDAREIRQAREAAAKFDWIRPAAEAREALREAERRGHSSDVAQLRARLDAIPRETNGPQPSTSKRDADEIGTR